MDATRLARLNTALAVAAVGLAVGHLVAPYRGGAAAVQQAEFWGAMVAVGAWRGWREARVREASAAATRFHVAGTAAIAVGLAIAAYWLVHGWPF